MRGPDADRDGMVHKNKSEGESLFFFGCNEKRSAALARAGLGRPKPLCSPSTGTVT